MSDPCQRLPDFLDGHLDDAEEQAFALHFVDCRRCIQASEEINALDALTIDAEEARAAASAAAIAVVPAGPDVAAAPDGGRVISITWRRTRQAAVVVLAMAAAFAIGLRMRGGWGTEHLVEDLVASQPERPLEGRVAVAAADVYRTHRARDVMRGDGLSELVRRAVPGPLSAGDSVRGGGSSPSVARPSLPPMERMARLVKQGHWQELATAWMLAGNLEEAERTLALAPDSSSVRSDGAALAIMRGRPEQALVLADSAMSDGSASSQALWNRGLALRDLGLTAVAARTFREVAARAESGWSDEARRLAESLEAPLAAWRRDFRDTWEIGDRMFRKAGPPLSVEQAIGHPGIARLFLYDALRAAPSRERVAELAPLADALDRLGGGHALGDLARRVAQADFAQRAPLAAAYPAMIPADKRVLAAAVVDPYLEKLRRTGQSDILLGALWPPERLATHLDEYRRLARDAGDPWFDFILAEANATALVTDGKAAAARDHLLAALETCHMQDVEYRCNKLEAQLVSLFRRHGSPVEAGRMARLGLAHARDAGEWNHAQRFLMFLGQIELDRRAFALSDAYSEEARLRQLDDAAVRDFAAAQREVAPYHELHRALAALETLQIAQAREAVASYQRTTRAPVDIYGWEVLAELQHWEPAAASASAEQQRIRAGLAELHDDPSIEPGQRALTSALAARMVAEQDPAKGRPLLEHAIAEAEAVPDRSDVAAARARAGSYAALASNAGRSAAWDEALGLLSRSLDLDEPGPCSLGVAFDYDRLLVAARDREGHADGLYQPHRPAPYRAAELVPERVRSALASCEVVDVYSRLSMEESAGLLPPDVAWRYRMHSARRLPAAGGAMAAGGAAKAAARRLVVAQVTPPAWLGLPQLSSRLPDRLPRPGWLRLEGEAATPSRVLAAMEDVGEIEFQVHGLVDPALSDVSVLALSRDSQGRYALTADDVRRTRLRGAPLVILAACRAGASAPSRHRPWGLPMAFLEAGARAVLASPEPLSDRDANPFFEDVRLGIAAGQPAAVALRNARKNARNNHLHPSLFDVQLFE